MLLAEARRVQPAAIQGPRCITGGCGHQTRSVITNKALCQLVSNYSFMVDMQILQAPYVNVKSVTCMCYRYPCTSLIYNTCGAWGLPL
jgi:hypothetical protein